MGKRSDALELARFLAFDGQDADAIAGALQGQCGWSAHAAPRIALTARAPPPEPRPAPASADAGSLFPPY